MSQPKIVIKELINNCWKLSTTAYPAAAEKAPAPLSLHILQEKGLIECDVYNLVVACSVYGYLCRRHKLGSRQT